MSDLVDTLRAKGVVKYIQGSDGYLELLLGPPPPPKGAKISKDPRSGKRAHYMNLLGRSHITDAELDMLPDGV